MAQGLEYKTVRLDFEMMKMGFSEIQKGEILERLIGVEVETAVEGVKFGKGYVKTSGGIAEPELDCIIYDDRAFPDNIKQHDNGRSIEVKNDDVICAIEARTDVSESSLQDEINEGIRRRQNIGDFPVFLLGYRHYNSIDEIREESIANETVVCGTLNVEEHEWGRYASEMVEGHNGEFARLINAVEQAKTRS